MQCGVCSSIWFTVVLWLCDNISETILPSSSVLIIFFAAVDLHPQYRGFMGGHGDFRPDNVSNYRFRKPNSIRKVRLLSVEPMSSGINSLIPIPRTVLYWVWGEVSILCFIFLTILLLLNKQNRDRQSIGLGFKQSHLFRVQRGSETSSVFLYCRHSKKRERTAHSLQQRRTGRVLGKCQQ
jgi:hypothetical protein